MRTLATIPEITTDLFSGKPPMGYHTWSDLLFVHWRVPPESLGHLIPDNLEIATFDGDVWLGLVAFHMSNVRPNWFPTLPIVSEFHETNIRTYVTAPDGEIGVRFLSLDAASWPAVKVARWRWHLPYYHAAMSLEREADCVRYASHRRRKSDPCGNLKLEARLGEVVRPHTASEDEARKFDADFDELGRFLIDRYLLFADDNLGGLLRGEVRHNPYPIRSATVTTLDETLTDALGIPINGRAPDHVVFSAGVNVDVFPLDPVLAP
jgi:uncharacterized protein YqjF (DUF2071 family)